MKVKSESEKAREYLESHTAGSHLIKMVGPCITVSRQSGAGSGIVDEKLKDILRQHQSEEYGDWEIFDKNLIEKVLEDHNLPERLGKLFHQEKHSSAKSMVSELLGLQPSMYSLLHKTTHTILQLAQMGNVIIVGRAGNIITAHLPNSFHVRLVAPLEDRIKRMMDYYNVGRKEALAMIKNEDDSRKEYLHKHFHKDIDDLLLYHLVLNTNLLSYEETANIIANAVMKKFPKMFLIHQESAVL
ncbi:MAG: cytidylate kinase-like family protein [Ignavibacteriales bacterium]|nr:cytidylate kinase-like family protein [Ignavibacteriales bacterium]